MSNNLCLGFNVEWYDSFSDILHLMQIKYFVSDGTIEILENNKIFLKRIFYPEIKLEHLFIGGSVTVYNRLLAIKNYCNVATENWMLAREVHILCKLNNASSLGEILNVAKRLNFRSGHAKTSATSFLSGSGSPVQVQAGNTLFEVVGNQGDDQYRQFIDATKRFGGCEFVRMDAKGVLDTLKECESIRVGARNCTLCMIKPHVIEKRDEGALIQSIVDQGFKISAVFTVHLTKAMASEIFDAYRSVVPSYTQYIDQIMVGTSIALMIEKPGSADVVNEFREFCGPFHTELAKVLRPASIRSKFGVDGVLNAVHCTDMQEDGPMECTYFFETLAAL